MAHWEKPEGATDEWYTPKYIFDALQCEFHLDVASPRQKTHVPADNFIYEDSLEKEWNGFIWMNPPFGGRNGLIPWLDKIALHGDGIALTPDRTSAPWWQKACLQSDAHLQIAGKVKFINGGGYIGTKPSNGTTLFAYGDKALQALKNAQLNNLGILLTRLS